MMVVVMITPWTETIDRDAELQWCNENKGRQQGQLEQASLACCITCTLPLWEALWRCVVRGTPDCWRFWGGEGRLKLLK
jgi:hypothetical protein